MPFYKTYTSLTKKIFSFLFICSVCVTITSCSNAIYQQQAYLVPFQQGDLSHAEERIDVTVQKTLPEKDWKKSGDATWLLLDQATIHFASGDVEAAIEEYISAIEALDYYSQKTALEESGKVILQDELGAYEGSDYEHSLARLYLAFALLHQGDESNAVALLKQAEEMHQKRQEMYCNSPLYPDYSPAENVTYKALLATLLALKGDVSNANILFNQAQEMTCENIEFLHSQIDRKKAHVWVVCHNGNIPRKISLITDASLASTVALEIFLHAASKRDFALSSLGGVPVPGYLCESLSSPLTTLVNLDGNVQHLTVLDDLSYKAEHELSQKMPVIVARGAARYLLRRGAVGYVSDHDQTLGTVADLAMLLANLNTKADTRSWSTLPCTLDLAAYELEPGPHQLEVRILDPHDPATSEKLSLQVPPGKLCIVHVFNLHPGVHIVQIPKRFVLGDLR